MPLIFLCLFLFAAPLCSQGQKKAHCDNPGYSQFDFWLGDWEVHSSGKLAGTNNVVKLWDCVVEENWEGTDGTKGKSFNTYDTKTGLWTQVWVDNTGRTLYFFGKADSTGAMVLEGTGGTSDGKEWYRLSFTPNEDGTVRQHWQGSKNAGKSWYTVFDGLYRKKKK